MINVSKQMLWSFALATMCFLHDPLLAAADNCPVLEGGTIAAEKILETLNNERCVTVKNAKVEGVLDFPQEFNEFSASNVTFAGPVDAYLIRAQKLKFDGCHFEAEANFHSAQTSSFWLNGSTFNGDVAFVSMQVGGLLNLVDVKFKKSADFSGAVIGELNSPRLRTAQPIQISWSQFGQTWLQKNLFWASNGFDHEDIQSRLQQVEAHLRFWQRNFLALGQQRDALETNHEILELKRRHFTNPLHIDWWAIALTGLPDRHGTRPYRPIWIGLVLILIFAIIYRVTDPFTPEKEGPKMPKTPLLLFSLLYSIDTFIPIVEITGVKKWGWHILPKYRWLAVAERLFGLVVSGLAAYSISSVAL